MSAVQRILVPIDGSPASLAALDHAMTLAEEGDANIDVLHVEAAPEGFGTEALQAPDVVRELHRIMSEAFARAHERLGDRVRWLTMTGSPTTEIVQQASEGGYDLITMGTHGRIGRLHMMLGSVAESVVRNAPCPVLTVREASEGYQGFAERRHGRPTIAEQYAQHPR